MKISLITVCFNSEATIEETLKSVTDEIKEDLKKIYRIYKRAIFSLAKGE